MTETAPPPAGSLYVIAAPSGGGKTSLVRELLLREPGIRLSVSYTTRPPRRGEQEGVHYHFVDEPTFTALRAAGEFLEHAFVHGNWYATSATWLKQQIQDGHDVLLEIDWQGAGQVRRLIPSAVLIFILPPSLASLKERLEKRGQDSAAVIQRRLEAVGNPCETVFDGDACHAGAPVHNFNKSAMRAACRTCCRVAARRAARTITDRSSTALAKS